MLGVSFGRCIDAGWAARAAMVVPVAEAFTRGCEFYAFSSVVGSARKCAGDWLGIFFRECHLLVER